MQQVTTIQMAQVMEVLPELVDELRSRLSAEATDELDLAYDWLLQQDSIAYTPRAVLMPSDERSATVYRVGKQCNCPDATFRGNPRCKHIKRAWLFTQALRRVAA